MTPINPVNWQVTSAPVNLVDMWAADLLSSLADWSATSTPVNLDDQLTNSLPHIEISGHNMNWHFDPRPVNPSGRNFHTQTYWAWTPYPEWPLVHRHSSLQDYSDCSSPKHDNWYSIGPCSHLFGAMSGYTQVRVSSPKPWLLKKKCRFAFCFFRSFSLIVIDFI